MHKLFLISLLICLALTDCKNKSGSGGDIAANGSRYQPKKYVELQHPEWSKNATIYELNIRQFSKEGNFKAVEAALPRLKEMGIDIIWLMPIHPIGIQNRKGFMGSYYSVKDYYGVNPEFGTKEEFKTLVKKIHGMGMHVILDWVANHSAWDNPLAKEHPEWYTKTSDGKFQPTPWYDWEDIIDFDYNQPGIRKYMTDALKYWVKETGIDGYRCDVAGFMPTDFWENARAELDAIKPVFMLAEWESRDLHKKAFDMTYSWSLWDKMYAVAKENKNINGLVEYMAHDVSTFPQDAYRMTFTDNHDKNSWEGNQMSNFGEALPACMVMAGTVNGMPLVYSGQEAGLDRSLQFFDKDSISWKPHPFVEIYKKLFALKHSNQALWNGSKGGTMVRIFNNRQDKIISFSREKNGQKVIPIINFSSQPVTVVLRSNTETGSYKELFTEKLYELKGEDELTIPAWGYFVLYK
ncbi:MAG: alpha-glucosidase C-terminal domain-containing protein [Rhizobacter sp.]|nr:alpha-glucosidase C-terminal domain-containing protein [Ferruginibacter sp.]